MDTPSRPHPLRSRAFAAAVVTASVATLVLLGIISPDEGEAWTQVATLWIAVGVAGGITVATVEPVVTPVSDPMDDAGNRLTPEA